MTTKNLTYIRPDGAKGVGYFIPFAGKYVHSIAWPDQHAERYTVDRLDRMRIQVEGMETIGRDGREYLRSELGWRFLTDEEAAEAQATVAEQLGVDPGEFFATGPELSGDELAVAAAEDESMETATEEASQEVKGETDDEEPVNEAQAIRDYLAEHPEAANKDVIAALAERGIEIASSQVTRQRKAIGKA